MQANKGVRRVVVAYISLLVLGAAAAAGAQQSLGSLKTEGADITGMVNVSGGRATLTNSGSITANAHPAEVALGRGGSVKVCTGSAVRLSQPSMGVLHPPLLMALNRGAMEIHTAAEKNDVIMTPDLRFELSEAAKLDLRVRLVANGDTCVDNSGKDAPMLHVTEAFGTGAYFIRPGQRVLFEHGSLREVVDHETSSCGCPKTDANVLAGKGRQGDGKVTPQAQAAQANPFPEAVSQGLQPPTIPQAALDQTHVQVSSTLAYSGTTNTVTGPPGEFTSPGISTTSTPATAATTGVSTATPAANVTALTAVAPPVSAPNPPTEAKVVSAAPPPAGPNPLRAIGHFFKRLFGGR